MPSKKNTQKYSHADFHADMTKLGRKAISALLALVLGQFMFVNQMADAVELTLRSLLECTNAIRVEYTDTPLYVNEKLNDAALAKLQNMKQYNYWAHSNPETGEMPWDFVDGAGYPYETAGENLAFGYTTAQRICDEWQNSETHLANIKHPDFQEVGFAINRADLHKNGKGILVVQMFGSRTDFASPREAAPTDPDTCLTTQGCEEKGLPESVLGVSNDNQHPFVKLLIDNFFIFVIIGGYLAIKALVAAFTTKSKKR